MSELAKAAKHITISQIGNGKRLTEQVECQRAVGQRKPLQFNSKERRMVQFLSQVTG